VHHSAHRGTSIECDVLCSIFRATPWPKRWKKAAKCCRILVRFSITPFHFKRFELGQQ